MSRPLRILGIDPGLRITGFGVIDIDGQKIHHVANGAIKVPDGAVPQRLAHIFREVSAVVREHRPQQMAIEEVFVHRNAGSALKLGQARGAAICAAAMLDIPVDEYAPRQIKQSVVGTGAADKTQVQHMIRMLLGITGALQADAADALAVALCHGHTGQTAARLGQAVTYGGGRLR